MAKGTQSASSNIAFGFEKGKITVIAILFKRTLVKPPSNHVWKNENAQTYSTYSARPQTTNINCTTQNTRYNFETRRSSMEGENMTLYLHKTLIIQSNLQMERIQEKWKQNIVILFYVCKALDVKNNEWVTVILAT